MYYKLLEDLENCKMKKLIFCIVEDKLHNRLKPRHSNKVEILLTQFHFYFFGSSASAI